MESSPQRPALLVSLVGKPADVRRVLAAADLGVAIAVWSPERESPSEFAARMHGASDVVVATGVAEEIQGFESQLGWSPDLQLSADDPAAAEELRRARADFGEWTKLGLWGGAAGGVEMGIGSLLHAVRVPLRGMIMCSVQAGVMTFASATLTRPGRVLWVPLISAGLKAFSPGGGRIRPMAAICVQGGLFAMTVQTLGWNAVSLALGGALIGAWAALQGFFVQYLLLGNDLVAAYERVVRWASETWGVTAPSLPALLAAWTALHVIAAASLALAAWKLRAPPARLRAALERTAGHTTVQPAGATRGQRLRRELTRWQFWLPLGVVLAVLALAGRPAEDLAWLALRFVAVGFVLLALLSLFQPARLAVHLRRRGWWGPAAAFAGAFGPKDSPR